MEIDDIKVDFRQLEEKKRRNFEDRLQFVSWWANYLKKNPESAFKQHKDFVDSLMKKAR